MGEAELESIPRLGPLKDARAKMVAGAEEVDAIPPFPNAGAQIPHPRGGLEGRAEREWHGALFLFPFE